MKIKDHLLFIGELRVSDQEGGYASPAVEIGDRDLTVEIETFFEALRQPGADGISPPGVYRVRIDRVE
jgi:hypothetical protein